MPLQHTVTITKERKLTLLGGIRIDPHQSGGMIWRMHMQYEVAVTQCNIFTIDGEDKAVKDYTKKGGSLEEYVTENCMWEETLGTFYFEIDVQAV